VPTFTKVLTLSEVRDSDRGHGGKSMQDMAGLESKKPLTTKCHRKVNNLNAGNLMKGTIVCLQLNQKSRIPTSVKLKLSTRTALNLLWRRF